MQLLDEAVAPLLQRVRLLAGHGAHLLVATLLDQGQRVPQLLVHLAVGAELVDHVLNGGAFFCQGLHAPVVGGEGGVRHLALDIVIAPLDGFQFGQELLDVVHSLVKVSLPSSV